MLIVRVADMLRGAAKKRLLGVGWRGHDSSSRWHEMRICFRRGEMGEGREGGGREGMGMADGRRGWRVENVLNDRSLTYGGLQREGGRRRDGEGRRETRLDLRGSQLRSPGPRRRRVGDT